jgi:hypothetical protein
MSLLAIADSVQAQGDAQAAAAVLRKLDIPMVESQQSGADVKEPEDLATSVIEARAAEAAKDDPTAQQAIAKGFDLLERQFEEFLRKHPASQPEDAPVLNAASPPN